MNKYKNINDIFFQKKIINIQIQINFLESKTKKNIERCNILSYEINDILPIRESKDCVLQKSITSTFSLNSINSNN